MEEQPWPNVAPDELFLPPLTSHDILKPEAAWVADEVLVRLSRCSSLARRVLGEIADELLQRRAHKHLAFVRVSDYSRERLGLSASQLYELARVARALRELPGLRAAFEAGDVGWTKAREIASVATAATEDAWLALAREYTADGLKIAVKHLRSQHPAAGSTAAPQADDLRAAAEAAIEAAVAAANASGKSVDTALDEACDEGIDGEPTATLRIRCPRRVRRLWQRTCELASRVLGFDASPWQAAEAIAAESLSDAAGASAARPTTGATHEQGRPRVGAARVVRERFFKEPTGPLSGVADDCDDFDIIDSLRLHNPRVACVDVLPLSLQALARDLDSASPHELDRRMRVVLGAVQRSEAQLGALLRTFFAHGLHLKVGYLTQSAYVRNRLGMCSRKARGLVRIERKAIYVSRALAEAYAAGRLSWYRCLMLLPVVDEDNAQAWIERAGAVTARRLADETAWALEIQGSTPLPSSVMPPPMGESLDHRPCASCGHAHDFTGRPEGRDAGRQIRGHDIEPDPSVLAAIARCTALEHANHVGADVEVRVSGPASVISLLQEAIGARTKPGDAPWRGLERVLVHAKTYWESLPQPRDPVYARDGWRCAAPGCSSRRNLHDHHIRFRSQGGSGALDNRISLCAAHHLWGVHRGKMRVTGVAPHELHWVMGVRPDGAPLFETRGRGEAYEPPCDATCEHAACSH